jgi:hypothetical protein
MSVRPKTNYASYSATDINRNRNAKLNVELSSYIYLTPAQEADEKAMELRSDLFKITKCELYTTHGIFQCIDIYVDIIVQLVN